MSEIRASSAEKAAHLLDSAISARSVNAQGRDSHFVFTLHLFQHRWAPFLFFCGSVCLSQTNYNELYRNVFSLNPSTPATPSLLGGRSRLHLIDFGCCERTKTLGGAITIAGLGNVILGILNGQRHLPFKESKVTQLLREVLGSVSCQVRLGSVSCVMTLVSVWECHMSSPDIINVAMSTSNLSTETCFRQKLKCNDSFIIQSIQSCDSANSPHNIRQIPQSVTILLFRNHKKLDSPVN